VELNDRLTELGLRLVDTYEGGFVWLGTTEDYSIFVNVDVAGPISLQRLPVDDEKPAVVVTYSRVDATLFDVLGKWM
jgi:hypothetical protein